MTSLYLTSTAQFFCLRHGRSRGLIASGKVVESNGQRLHKVTDRERLAYHAEYGEVPECEGCRAAREQVAEDANMRFLDAYSTPEACR